MELQPFVDAVRHQLLVAAAAGGDDAVALADRLTAPLDVAIRLTLLDALSTAAEEITRELAPSSVEVRLRGQEPEFVLTAATADGFEPTAVALPDGDPAGGTWRVTLRLPDEFRTAVDAAARTAGQSVNAWMVGAVAAALGAGGRPRRTTSDTHLSGWVR